jgi:hypothetical protein
MRAAHCCDARAFMAFDGAVHIYRCDRTRARDFPSPGAKHEHREDEMAHTAYAGDTATTTQDFGARVAGGVKRVFAALIRAREREAMTRIQAHLDATNHPYTIENGRIRGAR